MYSINDKCIEFPKVLKPLAGSLLCLHERIVLDTSTGHANKRDESQCTKLGLLRETILTAAIAVTMTIDVCLCVHPSEFLCQETFQMRHAHHLQKASFQITVTGNSSVQFHNKDRCSNPFKCLNLMAPIKKQDFRVCQ